MAMVSLVATGVSLNILCFYIRRWLDFFSYMPPSMSGGAVKKYTFRLLQTCSSTSTMGTRGQSNTYGIRGSTHTTPWWSLSTHQQGVSIILSNSRYFANQSHSAPLPWDRWAQQLPQSTSMNLNKFACDWFQQPVNRFNASCEFAAFFGAPVIDTPWQLNSWRLVDSMLAVSSPL